MTMFTTLVRFKPLRPLFRMSPPAGVSQAVSVFGLTFRNKLGIAAGFDKNGLYIDALAIMGFGHIEVGTVTPRAQSGNPRPRLFRLKASNALINRMGFNNDGVKALATRLARHQQRDFILGANIGKNKDTPNSEAVGDYIKCFNELHPFVDYFTVNVSSPNTPGLRELQDKEPLMRILSAISDVNNKLPVRRPLLLKIAPDLTESQLDDIASIAADVPLDGLIISNTTIVRGGLSESDKTVEAIGNGGLSGRPVYQRSTEVLEYLRRELPEGFPVIGVGGIDSVETAKSKLRAGADLIQIYTGFIYQGPGLVRKILAI